MQLNADQLEELRRAKDANQTRVTLRFTEEQKQEYQRAVEQELAGKDANIEHVKRIRVAAEQPGLFGDLRRAIHANRRSLQELAQQIGIEPRTLSDFCADEAALPPAVLDRLAALLGLRLMQEIRR